LEEREDILLKISGSGERKSSMKMELQRASTWEQEAPPHVRDYLMALFFASVFPVARLVLDCCIFEVHFIPLKYSLIVLEGAYHY